MKSSDTTITSVASLSTTTTSRFAGETSKGNTSINLKCFSQRNFPNDKVLLLLYLFKIKLNDYICLTQETKLTKINDLWYKDKWFMVQRYLWWRINRRRADLQAKGSGQPKQLAHHKRRIFRLHLRLLTLWRQGLSGLWRCRNWPSRHRSGSSIRWSICYGYLKLRCQQSWGTLFYTLI